MTLRATPVFHLSPLQTPGGICYLCRSISIFAIDYCKLNQVTRIRISGSIQVSKPRSLAPHSHNVRLGPNIYNCDRRGNNRFARAIKLSLPSRAPISLHIIPHGHHIAFALDGRGACYRCILSTAEFCCEPSSTPSSAWSQARTNCAHFSLPKVLKSLITLVLQIGNVRQMPTKRKWIKFAEWKKAYGGTNRLFRLDYSLDAFYR